MAVLSILGLYNYDDGLFDNMTLPADIDKDLLVMNLLAECAELEVVYPDISTMKFVIGTWSKTMQYKWAKLAESMKLQYNPIENYDRIEESTDDVENGVSAFNSDSYQNASKAVSNRQSRIHGNIGVTTSQQMLMSEREVADFSIYDAIINDFKQRFCLLIY